MSDYRNRHGEMRAILIGGTSHVGKSTVARVVGERLGWEVVSTDMLGRHPGRPWKTAPEEVPGHVAWHYLSMPVEGLVEDVLRHYRVNIWPRVEAVVRERSGSGVVVEGSAVWPELAAGLKMEGVAGLWLTGSEGMLERRIRAESADETRDARGRELIDRFVGRTLRFNALIMKAVERLGFASVRVEEGMEKEVVDACVRNVKLLSA
jgi:2-phosphoglycerate kinase